MGFGGEHVPSDTAVAPCLRRSPRRSDGLGNNVKKGVSKSFLFLLSLATGSGGTKKNTEFMVMMRIPRILLCFALAALTACAARKKSAPAQQSEPSAEPALEAALPLDPQIVAGELENGFRCLIRVNQKPEKRAEFRLTVDVGSVLEEEGEQGLAHFGEHMAFNGTADFAKQELVDYLETIGMRPGPDLNAGTGFDETVYMLTVPTDRSNFVLEAMADVLEIRLREVLREDLGGTYHVSVDGSGFQYPGERYRIDLSFGCDPERVEELAEVVFEQIDSLKTAGTTGEYLTKAKETARRKREVQRKENEFWVSRLMDDDFHGLDPLRALEYDEMVDSLTLEEVGEAAERYFDLENYVRVVLLPGGGAGGLTTAGVRRFRRPKLAARGGPGRARALDHPQGRVLRRRFAHGRRKRGY